MEEDIEKSKNNLINYIENDPYFNGTYKPITDFEKFCYEHCKDIENLIARNKELESALDNSVSKDEIKEKIEELDKRYKGIEANYTEEELDNGDEIGLDDYIEMEKIQMSQRELQELLNKGE